jgi:hypothetical protein
MFGNVVQIALPQNLKKKILKMKKKIIFSDGFNLMISKMIFKK